MKAGDWLVSRNEEQWSQGEAHVTRESAIAAAVAELDLEPGDYFWVGRVADVEVQVDAADVVELIGDRVYEQVGDASDSWRPRVTPEASAEFDALIEAWLRKHGLHPADSCFSVEDVERVEVEP